MDHHKIPKAIQNEVSSFITANDEKRVRGKVEIDRQEADLQTAQVASQDKNLVRTVVGNASKTIIQKGSLLASVLPDDFAANPSSQTATPTDDMQTSPSKIRK